LLEFRRVLESNEERKFIETWLAIGTKFGSQGYSVLVEATGCLGFLLNLGCIDGHLG
jgi:hypothetical protein